MKKEDLINEGAAIQEGLERFLQEELAGMASKHSNQNERVAGEDIKKQVENYSQPVNREYVNVIPANQEYVNVIPTNKEYVNVIPSNSEYQRDNSINQEFIRGDFSSWDSERQKPEGRVPTKEKSKKQEKNSSSKRKKGKKKNEIKGKKMKKKKSGLKSFLTFLIVLVIIAMGGIYFLVGSVYNKMDYERAEDLVTEPMKEDGVTNILLIGNDSRSQGEDGRSDAMILLSISNKTKKIHMTSLLRDMYVEIPGKDGNRLNAAYAYGGPTLLLETIEQNLGITVNRYVLVNFQAFANLVDAVGGVDLELSNEEVKWVNAYLNEYNLLEGRDITTDYLDESLSGMIHLNGPQALAYCRNRYIGTDFERTNRQRKVIAGIVSKLPVALATNSGELADGLFPQLTTNLTQAECYSLSLQASKFLTYEMIQSSIPIEGSYKNATIRSMSVLEVDYEMNKQYIRENIYGEE